MADLRAAGRARLAALHGHLHSINETEKRILQQAQSRADEITKALDKLRPRVLLDTKAADQYTRLVEERGKMGIVIARAKKTLGIA